MRRRKKTTKKVISGVGSGQRLLATCRFVAGATLANRESARCFDANGVKATIAPLLLRPIEGQDVSGCSVLRERPKKRKCLSVE